MPVSPCPVAVPLVPGPLIIICAVLNSSVSGRPWRRDMLKRRLITPCPEMSSILTSPSVTGTENLLMAAVTAQGTTVIKNAAREPEVGNLIDMLTAMGADIEGRDTDRLTIHGVSNLQPAEMTIIPGPDRGGNLSDSRRRGGWRGNHYGLHPGPSAGSG